MFPLNGKIVYYGSKDKRLRCPNRFRRKRLRKHKLRAGAFTGKSNNPRKLSEISRR
jgi:hypothetical protein